MGTFTVALQLGDLSSSHFVDVEALVDTGSTYTVMPNDVLERLGITQEGQRSFELGDDRIVEYPIGYARMRLQGDETIVLVVFGPTGTYPLLGATALEHLSLAVDPIHQQLIPVPALLKQLRLEAEDISTRLKTIGRTLSAATNPAEAGGELQARSSVFGDSLHKR